MSLYATLEKGEPVIIVIILLVGALGILVGYAVRQRQTLHENADTIKDQEDKIERLVRENEACRNAKEDHERNLEMVLDELEQTTS